MKIAESNFHHLLYNRLECVLSAGTGSSPGPLSSLKHTAPEPGTVCARVRGGPGLANLGASGTQGNQRMRSRCLPAELSKNPHRHVRRERLALRRTRQTWKRIPAGGPPSRMLRNCAGN